jgi:hypothetical protein
MRHLADRGVLVPAPVANDKGELITALHGKPASIVTKLEGSSQMDPQPVHCAEVGAMLAKMHLAGLDYKLQQPNLRGLDWWHETTPLVLPYIPEDKAHLLKSEVHYQETFAACDHYKQLQVGPVHADLFRNNVMFSGDTPDRLLRLLLRRLRHLAVRRGRHRQRLVHRPRHRRAGRSPRARHAGRLPRRASVHRSRAARLADHAARRRAALLAVAPV